MARTDPHSYTDSRHIELAEIDWRARVDFETRRIEATAILRFGARPGAPPHVDLDTRGLEIIEVGLEGGVALGYHVGAPDPILGSRLRVDLPAAALAAGGAIAIRYKTSPDASALQWLTPAQTAGGQRPFLFTQCQAIHARSLLPLQDTPRQRIRYRATLSAPAGFRALMAARHLGTDEQANQIVERWEMPEPIPPYLFAFAVGELRSAELGPRSRVWAEPAILARAAHEFAEVDSMLLAAEVLFGRYDWERFDLLVMPPSFPYGGMENPRLTFLTPTLLAGDRSLTAVVAHELAHSWTGNLVSGASAEHFWLNEGMTVWAERRIVEALHGRDRAELDAALGRRELEDALHGFRDRPHLTSLRTSLDGVDPDAVFSVVPYEKGYLLARALEEAVGRSAFDRFVATYVRELRFRSITTDDFVQLVRAELPGALELVQAWRYVEQPGLPDSAPRAQSAQLARLEAQGEVLPDEALAALLGPTEWQLYLARLPRPFAGAAELERRFGLYGRSNHEIRAAFVELALDSGLEDALAQAEALVAEVGRMKYLRPIYAALMRRDPEAARKTFARLRDRYHPIAAQVIGGIVGSVSR